MPDQRFSRQSFLGDNSQDLIQNVRIGIVGLGGGGSQIAQQLAHIGFTEFVLYDSDRIDDTNLNRLVGSVSADVTADALKVGIAERLIKGINPAARVDAHPIRWQNDPHPLASCDIVFGAVDTFAGRNDLEALTRRYTIPYIDIGMDIHRSEPEPPRMAGQVILSMPGHLCMRCLGFLNDRNLTAEARRYGEGEHAPQVIWPLGVLVSTAVGIAVDLVTGWSKNETPVRYMSFDGNQGTLQAHVRMSYLDANAPCPHYPIAEMGDPVFQPL